MPTTLNEEQHDQTQEQLTAVTSLLESDDELLSVKHLLRGLSGIEIANLIESSPPNAKTIIWSLISESKHATVLQALDEDVAANFVKTMDSQTVAHITESLDADDAADILQQLPNRVIQEILSAMSAQNRARIETVLPFEEDTAGGLMDTNIITIRPRLTIDVVLRYLRRHDDIPASTDRLFVVNASNKYLGTLSINQLLTADPNATVKALMDEDKPIPVTMNDAEVAQRFKQNGWISAPVIDAEGMILGRITIDDVVDVIIDDADHSFMSMAGLDEDEDTFAPLKKTAPRRAIWLGINLITAILASSVINIFQDTIDKVVALAVLMPIVASMGGVAGSQTLTVVIRGIALGKIGNSNRKWLLIREVLAGLLNGLLWASALGLFTAWWFEDFTMAIIIWIATMINLFTAAIGGTLLPPALKRMGIDPALAGSVALTTLTDIVGFLAFLGLATLFYA